MAGLSAQIPAATVSSVEEMNGTETSRFNSYEYKLPQYTALFLNSDSDILVNKKVRFALLLATNKEEISEAVPEVEIVDTPILESKADLKRWWSACYISIFNGARVIVNSGV